MVWSIKNINSTDIEMYFSFVTVQADVLALSIGRLSAGTLMTTGSDIFSSYFSFQWFCETCCEQMTSNGQSDFMNSHNILYLQTWWEPFLLSIIIANSLLRWILSIVGNTVLIVSLLSASGSWWFAWWNQMLGTSYLTSLKCQRMSPKGHFSKASFVRLLGVPGKLFHLGTSDLQNVKM